MEQKLLARTHLSIIGIVQKRAPVSIQTYQIFPLMEQELSEFRESDKSFEFFTVCTKLAEMAILYSKDLTAAKKSYLQ